MSLNNRSSTSFYSTNSVSKKIPLQTKYKKRGTNQLLRLNEQFKYQNKTSRQSNNNHQQFQCQNEQQIESNQQNNDFNKTQKLLSKLNFSHHQTDNCVCKDCLCGRHLCKFHVIKPDIKKMSTYRNNFRKNKSYTTPKIIYKQDTPNLRNVQMNSTYTFSFKNNQTNLIQKSRPKDQLMFQGPLAQLSSYKTHFPGNKGLNPYVRPKQFYVPNQFSLKNTLSAYKKQFNGNNSIKPQIFKVNDQLKTGKLSCFKQSFYNDKFKAPNPQNYPQILKNQQKININPNYAYQFRSTYLKDFLPIKATLCPAKIKIESKFKNTFSDTKNNFNQNSDFKSMSNSYHALSLAPLGQY